MFLYHIIIIIIGVKHMPHTFWNLRNKSLNTYHHDSSTTWRAQKQEQGSTLPDIKENNNIYGSKVQYFSYHLHGKLLKCLFLKDDNYVSLQLVMESASNNTKPGLFPPIYCTCSYKNECLLVSDHCSHLKERG